MYLGGYLFKYNVVISMYNVSTNNDNVRAYYYYCIYIYLCRRRLIFYCPLSDDSFTIYLPVATPTKLDAMRRM